MPNVNKHSDEEPASLTKFEKRLIVRRKWALGGSGLLIAIGLAILSFALWRFFSEERGIGLVVPGCSLIAAGVASGVATLGLVSWAEQRERDREAKEYEHRENAYESIANFMLTRFMGDGYDREIDGQLRARAALWGSPKVIQSLATWQQDITKVLSRSYPAEEGGVVMSPSDSALVKRNLAAAVAAMRKDLGSSSAEVNRVDILRSIFNENIPDDFFAKEPAEPKD